MGKLIPVFIWVGFILVINILKAAGKKKPAAGTPPRPMHQPPPAVEEMFDVPPRRQPPPAEPLHEAETESLSDDGLEMVREFLKTAEAARRNGQSVERDAPAVAEEPTEEDGCHVTPMGAPHESALRDAKAPAIAHMEGHIGEAHGEELHPSSEGALRRLRRKPNVLFSRSPRTLREAIVLSEVLARPRAYKL